MLAALAGCRAERGAVAAPLSAAWILKWSVVSAIFTPGCSNDVPHSDRNLERRPIPVALEAESDSSLHLSTIAGIAVDSKGVVYVHELFREHITVLNRDLTYRQTIGRSGEGPGEFAYITRIAVLASDSLFVYDRELGRITIFDPTTMRLARQLPGPWVDRPRGQRWITHEVSRFVDSPAYLGVARRQLYASGDADGEQALPADIILSVDRTGVYRDSVLAVPSPERLVARRPGRVAVGPHPFGRTSWIRPLRRNRFVYANSGQFDVLVSDITGDTVQSISYPTTPLPVTTEQMDTHISDLRPELAAVLLDGAPYTWPPLVGLVVGSGVRSISIWVGIRGRSGDATWEWAGFTEAGEYVGSVNLPLDHRLMAVRDGTLLSASGNALGVPRIHAYRVIGHD